MSELIAPVVDLSSADAPALIDAACRASGFFLATGHGVDAALVSSMWRSCTTFFDLPLTERLGVAMPYPGYPYGYSPIAGERLAASLDEPTSPRLKHASAPHSPVAVAADLKESFAIGPVDARVGEMSDPAEAFAWSTNLWPQALPELRPTWEAYFRAMSDLAARLLRLMASGLGLVADWFDPLIDRHTSALRALNYPGATRGQIDATRLGASAHSDYGTITILLADPDVAGLEVLGRDMTWHDVAPVPGSFVVNLGDAMARWTNDRWRSTLHRVRVPTARRQSVAFFHNANWDAVIDCLPTCLDPGELPRYPPMAAGPHLMSKFTSTVVADPPA